MSSSPRAGFTPCEPLPHGLPGSWWVPQPIPPRSWSLRTFHPMSEGAHLFLGPHWLLFFPRVKVCATYMTLPDPVPAPPRPLLSPAHTAGSPGLCSCLFRPGHSHLSTCLSECSSPHVMEPLTQHSSFPFTPPKKVFTFTWQLSGCPD